MKNKKTETQSATSTSLDVLKKKKMKVYYRKENGIRIIEINKPMWAEFKKILSAGALSIDKDVYVEYREIA